MPVPHGSSGLATGGRRRGETGAVHAGASYSKVRPECENVALQKTALRPSGGGGYGSEALHTPPDCTGGTVAVFSETTPPSQSVQHTSILPPEKAPSGVLTSRLSFSGGTGLSTFAEILRTGAECGGASRNSTFFTNASPDIAPSFPPSTKTWKSRIGWWTVPSFAPPK